MHLMAFKNGFNIIAVFGSPAGFLDKENFKDSILAPERLE